MRRIEQLQGLRLMKFEEVYGRTYRGELSQLEAAEILGMSERTLLPRSTRPSPNLRRVGVHIFTFEACSGFTRVRPARSLNRPRRPLSQGFGPAGYPTRPPVSYQIKPTTVWVDPSSTGVTRRRGALRNPGLAIPQSDVRSGSYLLRSGRRFAAACEYLPSLRLRSLGSSVAPAPRPGRHGHRALCRRSRRRLPAPA